MKRLAFVLILVITILGAPEWVFAQLKVDVQEGDKSLVLWKETEVLETDSAIEFHMNDAGDNLCYVTVCNPDQTGACYTESVYDVYTPDLVPGEIYSLKFYNISSGEYSRNYKIRCTNCDRIVKPKRRLLSLINKIW